MSQYCYAPETTVIEGPTRLPESWIDPVTGVSYSNFNNLTDPQLLTLGWKPYSENDPGSPGAFYTRVLSPFVVTATDVTRDITYEQWDIERVKQIKNNELILSIREFTVTDLSNNPKVKEYVNDDSRWVAQKQAQLARLTDWNAVANFDTSKPLAFTLPNSIVAASYVNQGVALTAQNQADTGSGLTARWDQNTINAFVAANETAAADASNATAPVKPNYKIRQGIASVAEQFTDVIVWRFDVEGETDPNLDRSVAMRMTQRQDNRDIYTFIYTNAGATYLGFKKFVDIGDGVWEWYLDKGTPEAGDGAIMPWVDSDLAFILSYGDNPAVEADYFTNPIQFPAGVEEDGFLVAWDPV